MKNQEEIVYKKLGKQYVPLGIIERSNSILPDGLWWIHTGPGYTERTNYSYITQLFGPEKIKFSPRAICNINDESDKLAHEFFQLHPESYNIKEIITFVLSKVYESDIKRDTRTS